MSVPAPAGFAVKSPPPGDDAAPASVDEEAADPAELDSDDVAMVWAASLLTEDDGV